MILVWCSEFFVTHNIFPFSSSSSRMHLTAQSRMVSPYMYDTLNSSFQISPGVQVGTDKLLSCERLILYITSQSRRLCVNPPPQLSSLGSLYERYGDALVIMIWSRNGRLQQVVHKRGANIKSWITNKNAMKWHLSLYHYIGYTHHSQGTCCLCVLFKWKIIEKLPESLSDLWTFFRAWWWWERIALPTS